MLDSDTAGAANLFSTGGGETESKRLNVPILGKIPLSPELVDSSDSGLPYVLKYNQSNHIL